MKCFTFLCLISLLCVTMVANARPEYAQKEVKACQYCHVDRNPGLVNPENGKREGTARNERGQYYALHNHTFAGFVEAKLTRPLPPTFHFGWKEDLSNGPRRIAVGDVKGDGTPRLITLNEIADRKDASTLMIRKWDTEKKTFVEEFSAEAKTAPDRLAVGKFAGANQPAVIVTPDALWHWNGTTFVRKPSSRTLPIFGTAFPAGRGEQLILAESETDFKAYRVDPNAGGNWLVPIGDAPAATEVQRYSMRSTPEFLGKMGLGVYGAGGVVGVWNIPRMNNRKFLYYVRISPDFDITPDPANKNKPKITVKGKQWSVSVRDTADPDGNDLWFMPKMPGSIHDVALDDGKGTGKAGFLILTSESASGKGQSLFFFEQD